jgi:SAM-dependent methyltransferase
VRVRALVAGRDGEARPAVIEAIGEESIVRDDDPAAVLPHLPGLVTGRFTDAHVHLALVDPTALAGSPVGTVVDLGADPDAIRRVAASGIVGDGPPTRVEYAGAFLTPPGGYPSDRDWAPAGSVREVADIESAVAAVAEMAAAGASLIKVADNSTAGPVFDDETFRAIVSAADALGLPVVAHAEGRGEAVRAARLGARMLAHAPFDDVLGSDDIDLLARTVTCISTLAIHEGRSREVAVENVRRLHAAGGRIRYGTDMGNGPTPVGLNRAELDALTDAGLDTTAVLRALAPADARDPRPGLVLVPSDGDRGLDISAARLLTPADLRALG